MINFEIEHSGLWHVLGKLTERRLELQQLQKCTKDPEFLAELEWERRGIIFAMDLVHAEINKKGTTEVAPKSNESVAQEEPFNKEDINDKA